VINDRLHPKRHMVESSSDMSSQRKKHSWLSPIAHDAAKTTSSASPTSSSHAVLCFASIIAVDQMSESHRMLGRPCRHPTSERELADNAAKTS